MNFLKLSSCLFALILTTYPGQTQKPQGPRPDRPENNVKFSSYKPENPYTQFVPGLLSRKVFETPTEDAYQIEVREFFVLPGQRTSEFSLPGSAVFEVLMGSGVLNVSGKSQEAKTGSSFAYPKGAPVTFENKSDIPITLRAYVFASN